MSPINPINVDVSEDMDFARIQSILGPLYNADTLSENAYAYIKFLDAIPKWVWRYTCRCKRLLNNEVYDSERHMYVCETCRLPGPLLVFGPAPDDNDIVGSCDYCGDAFVVWRKYHDRQGYDRCANCGGDNAALAGQRTINTDNSETVE